MADGLRQGIRFRIGPCAAVQARTGAALPWVEARSDPADPVRTAGTTAFGLIKVQ